MLNGGPQQDGRSFGQMYRSVEVRPGCHWPTSFGGLLLNLNGLCAREAQLAARATAGIEQREWSAAAEWLSRVEYEVSFANTQACQAADLADMGRLEDARTLICDAVEREERYQPISRWRGLRDAITQESHPGLETAVPIA